MTHNLRVINYFCVTINAMPKPSVDHAVSALLARFRRQRPLRSGSLLVTIFGDSIVPRGGAVTLGSLIGLAQPFGLTERLVRTSVGRLAKEGWIKSRRAGRQSEYSLTRRGQERFTEATQRIYAEPPRDWDHRWTLLLLQPSTGTERDRVREEMLWLGFGQLAPGVLAHPSRSAADTRRQLREMGMTDQAVILQADSGGLEQDRQLISTGWDLAELARLSPVREQLHTGRKRACGRRSALAGTCIPDPDAAHPRVPQDLPARSPASAKIAPSGVDRCRSLCALPRSIPAHVCAG